MARQHSNKNAKGGSSDFFVEHIGILKFYLLAIIIFAAFYLSYTTFFLNSEPFNKYLELLASMASQFVNIVFGEESYVALTEARLRVDIWVSDGANVAVGEGCDASTVFAVLIATVLAWPSKIWLRVCVALLGLVLMFGLNILRIAVALLADIYYPLQFDMLNDWVLPNLLIVVALVYFYLWTKISGRHPDE